MTITEHTEVRSLLDHMREHNCEKKQWFAADNPNQCFREPDEDDEEDHGDSSPVIGFVCACADRPLIRLHNVDLAGLTDEEKELFNVASGRHILANMLSKVTCPTDKEYIAELTRITRDIDDPGERMTALKSMSPRTAYRELHMAIIHRCSYSVYHYSQQGPNG